MTIIQALIQALEFETIEISEKQKICHEEPVQDYSAFFCNTYALNTLTKFFGLSCPIDNCPFNFVSFETIVSDGVRKRLKLFCKCGYSNRYVNDARR